MLGKTHAAIGTAATLALTLPSTPREILLAVGAGTIGSLISDIDVGTSKSHKQADRITICTLSITGIILVLDYFFNMGIIDKIFENSNLLRILSGFLIFVGICAYGKDQPHRSFMHSFCAGIILCFAVGLIYEPIIPCFAIGFLSHLTLDIFNKKRVRLFFPAKKGFCLGMVSSHGFINKKLCFIGSSISVILIVILLYKWQTFIKI